MAAMNRYDAARWADAAVRGIVSKQEQARARQELLDHMEDHAEALMAAGFSAGEAQQQAVLAMGDPEVTARLLRKAHQPLLTRILQVCRWTVVCLAAALALQLAVSLFDSSRGIVERLWCGDPLTLYGYHYYQTETLPEGVLARRVADTEGSADLDDYFLTVQKAALDKTEAGTRLTMLLEMKADRLWYGRSRMQGTVTVTCGGETFSQEIAGQSHFRRLRRHYHYVFARFQGDLLKEESLILSFTNGERSFTLPVTLKGGDVHEK